MTAGVLAAGCLQTPVSATLPADVVLAAGAWADGPTLGVLAAGTWLVMGRALIQNLAVGGQVDIGYVRIADAAGVIYAEGGGCFIGADINFTGEATVIALVVLAVPTEVKLQATSVRSGDKMLRDLTNYSNGTHTATQVIAARVHT